MTFDVVGSAMLLTQEAKLVVAGTPRVRVSRTPGRPTMTVAVSSFATDLMDYNRKEEGRNESMPRMAQVVPFGNPRARREDVTVTDQLERNPSYYGGRPMLPGTGLPAWIVADMLQAGESIDDVLDAYPYLTRTVLDPFVRVLLNTPLRDLGAPTDE